MARFWLGLNIFVDLKPFIFSLKLGKKRPNFVQRVANKHTKYKPKNVDFPTDVYAPVTRAVNSCTLFKSKNCWFYFMYLVFFDAHATVWFCKSVTKMPKNGLKLLKIPKTLLQLKIKTHIRNSKSIQKKKKKKKN